MTTPAGTGITVRAYGDQCNGAPSLTLAMDGTNVLTVSVSATSWTSYPVSRAVGAGSHTFTVSYTNDSKTSSCDRNLRFDSLTITGTGGGGGGDTTPPGAPISLAASPGNGSASLTWAPNTESDLAGYNVFRSTSSGGPYTKDNTALVTTASYNDTGLTNGTKYFWVVQAVDTSNNSSGNSNETSTTPTAGPDTTPPAPPSGLNATGGDTTVALNWAPNTESDLAGYNVLRSTTNGGPYTKINTSLVANPSFNDTGLTNGTPYYYVVQAVDSSTNTSGNSSQASGTPSAGGGGGGGGGSTLIEAESFTIPSDFGGKVYTDSSASGGKAVSFWSNDSISKTVTTVAGSTITVRAFGDQCNGAPSFTLAMDGTNVFTSAVPAGSWTNYSASKTVGAGSHTFALSYTNDSRTSSCDRNLRVDSITIGSGSGGTPTQMLPDLVQQPPLQVSVTQSSASYRIGFNSAVENHGQGPLIINGHRPDTSSTMVADQIVNRTDGSTQTFAGIGSMIFYVPHNHWHYVGFDKYELRNPADNSLVAPDQKSGFCLGDRYTPNSNGTRNENPTPGPWTTNNCAPGNTAALNLTEGISVGYGDEYVPQLEGQYIDVTGVQPGQYWVVFRTNADQALKETDYTNDAASVLIQLWPNGYGNLTNGGVTVLKTCPGTATCSLAANAPTPSSFKFSHFGLAIGGLPFQLRHSPPPDDAPLLVPHSARFFAHQALQKVVGKGSAKARLRCTRASRRGFRCAVSWRVAGSSYKGTVEVSLPQHNNQYWWIYRARLVRRGAAGFKQIRTTLRRVQVTHNGRY